MRDSFVGEVRGAKCMTVSQFCKLCSSRSAERCKSAKQWAIRGRNARHCVEELWGAKRVTVSRCCKLCCSRLAERCESVKLSSSPMKFQEFLRKSSGCQMRNSFVVLQALQVSVSRTMRKCEIVVKFGAYEAEMPDSFAVGYGMVKSQRLLWKSSGCQMRNSFAVL